MTTATARPAIAQPATAHPATAQPGLSARAVLAAEAIGSRTRMTTLRSDPPLTFRSTPNGIMWVGTAAGPIGGDELRLRVQVGPEAHLAVRSAGAAVVLPGPHGLPSSFTIEVEAADGASLWWYPEPTIVAAGADHAASTTISVGAHGDLLWVDEVVLGRHGEVPGRLRSRLRLEHGSDPILCTGLDLGRPGWDGPAGVGSCRAVAQVVVRGRPARALGRHVAGGTGVPLASMGPGCRLAASEVDGATMLVNVTGSALAVRRTVADVVALASVDLYP